MIRKIEKRDVLPCVEIVNENWNKATALRFHEEVKHAFRPGLKWPPEYFVWEDDGKVAAFAGMMPSWIMRGVWDLIWINVKKKYKGTGLGTILTNHRIATIEQRNGAVINLMTQKHNAKFFEGFQFEIVRRYSGDWYLMTRQLKELEL